uniref:Uncharacterized protein n=1 Tax=mine drainage metagenome TaxID=410659 RepID=E6QBC7_9ZZZZ
MDAQQQALRDFTKYIWWKTPDDALQYERRLIAQVMNLGDWEDTRRLETTFGQEKLVDSLKNAEAGWFTPRMWNFWHYRLGLAQSEDDIPTPPVRRFQ